MTPTITDQWAYDVRHDGFIGTRLAVATPARLRIDGSPEPSTARFHAALAAEGFEPLGHTERDSVPYDGTVRVAGCRVGVRVYADGVVALVPGASRPPEAAVGRLVGAIGAGFGGEVRAEP